MAYGGRSQLKMSEETFDFVCTACARDGQKVEAVKYCTECRGYCCRPCTDVHKKFPALSGHNLMEVDQGKVTSGQPSSLPEFPTERCTKHKGKVLDMYCEGHNTVGCSTCFVQDHKSCQASHIHSIPDMIDTIFNLADCKHTQKLLKDMVVSMKSVSKSKDTQLQSLNKAKKETLDKVTIFQKALEAILRKAAETSKQAVESAYKSIENEILLHKCNAETIRNNLQTTDDKLDQSEGNRAQRFVCTKIGEEQIKEAEKEKTKQELHHAVDVPISFIPDQSCMEYLQALQGIGQVQKHGNRKNDLYKIKGSKDITIKVADDSKQSNSFGCCLLHGNNLLVTDVGNRKLKRIDIQKMSVVDYCTLDSGPYGVCCISKHEVAVACQGDNKIQFISIQGKMSPTRQIKMSHKCYGIAFNDDKLYVTDDGASLYVYDMTGTRLKTITQDNAGNKLFDDSRHITFNASCNTIFVADRSQKNVLVRFDGVGNYLSSVTDTDIKHGDGVCVDGRGNVFVVGYGYLSNTVVQYSEEGKKVGMVVKKGDGLQRALSVCFHQGLNRMFVTTYDSDVVKMYELE